MSPKRILILNGPNLNLLGRRQPGIYGSRTLDDIIAGLSDLCRDRGVVAEHFQSNHEGELIDRIHAVGFDTDTYLGIVLNAGAYTHTSVALADAIAAVPLPVVEVHISNIFAREDFRSRSLIAPVCKGSISGFGEDSYKLAVLALLR